MDTPKDDAEELHGVGHIRAKSTTALRDRHYARCTDPGASADDIDAILSEAVFNLPNSGPLQRSMFTLSRLPEAETTSYIDSSGGSPHVISARRENQPPLRLRSSASSMSSMTPRRPKQTPNASGIYFEETYLQKKEKENRDPDLNLNRQWRSVSSVDFLPSTHGDASCPLDSPVPPAERPETRLDSRLCLGHGHHKSALDLTAYDLSEASSSYRSAESTSDQPTSFRSDQILFHNSMGYKQLRMETGVALSGRSEENACIGKRSSQNSHDLRRMKFRGADVTSFLASQPVPISEGDENEVLGESIDETFAQTEGRAADESKVTPRDNEDESVMEEPRNLAMWLEWLEERADVTRKEILYRMGCQRAFIQEAKEKLRSHAIAAAELEDVWQPLMRDRLAILRSRCLKKARKHSRRQRTSLDINDDAITDINFNDVAISDPAPRLRPVCLPRRTIWDLM